MYVMAAAVSLNQTGAGQWPAGRLAARVEISGQSRIEEMGEPLFYHLPTPSLSSSFP